MQSQSAFRLWIEGRLTVTGCSRKEICDSEASDGQLVARSSCEFAASTAAVTFTDALLKGIRDPPAQTSRCSHARTTATGQQPEPKPLSTAEPFCVSAAVLTIQVALSCVNLHASCFSPRLDRLWRRHWNLCFAVCLPLETLVMKISPTGYLQVPVLCAHRAISPEEAEAKMLSSAETVAENRPVVLSARCSALRCTALVPGGTQETLSCLCASIQNGMAQMGKRAP